MIWWIRSVPGVGLIKTSTTTWLGDWLIISILNDLCFLCCVWISFYGSPWYFSATIGESSSGIKLFLAVLPFPFVFVRGALGLGGGTLCEPVFAAAFPFLQGSQVNYDWKVTEPSMVIRFRTACPSDHSSNFAEVACMCSSPSLQRESGGLGISCQPLADELRREKLPLFNRVFCLVDLQGTIDLVEGLAFWSLEGLEGSEQIPSLSSSISACLCQRLLNPLRSGFRETWSWSLSLSGGS